jgi:DUF2075 family protein/DNA replication protein DnaC
MIVYQNNLKTFKEQVETNVIEEEISTRFEATFKMRPNTSEQISWRNSLAKMNTALSRAKVDESAEVLIEYNLPATRKRIDFIVAGEDEEGNKNFIIVELKQWSEADVVDQDQKDVISFVRGVNRRVTHPSYQATSYKNFLKDFNEDISTNQINPYSCAYLHNYKKKNPEPLLNENYQASVKESPIYFKDDTKELETFLNKYVGKGNGRDIVYTIENGKIRPTKFLIDHVSSLLKGNKDFTLIDEQKVAFELAKHNVKMNKDKKSVLLIKGGPGTGKSVISINLLAEFLNQNKNVLFVAPNSSFRDVVTAQLSRGNDRRVRHLFKGSSQFVKSKENEFDVIVVDEAHRLKDFRAYMYQGENQIRDIINASKNTIFFVDDNQIIRPDDIGSTSEIKKVAREFGIEEIDEIELVSQFRCSGSDGYLNWLDDVLQIKETANFDGFDKNTFDFQIIDNPHDLYEKIKSKNIPQNKSISKSSRLLAGYAWKWTSEREGNARGEIEDVEISEYNFKKPWNSRNAGTTWAIDPKGIEEIGCIHTTQGLEFEYVGVIIGNEFKFDPKTNSFRVDYKAYKDVKGKSGLKDEPEILTKLVKNIYKTLMTRGQKGCYVYISDKNLREYLNNRLASFKYR